MSVSWIEARFPALAAAALAATLAFASPSYAQNSGPFGSLAGRWEGAGTIAINNTNERIRCRANYRVAGGGSVLAIELRCASDSYKFELQSDVRSQNGEVRGD